ncbi:MAG: hypothetical protein KAS96_00335, partial [Planctomycetes bacterium]|nr:hypothetical protein [Planctomycetota bacterium]
MNFQDTYKRAAYLDFFRDTLLPEDFYITNEPIDFQTDITKKVVKIGEVPSLDLPVFEIKHKSENDPRVTLSKEAFRILANYGKQQALILFISTKAANFRLSLVTLDLKLEGKKPKTAFSNPRRYSFFLGPEAKLHTIQEYLSKPGRVKDFEDLKSRFSIEVVNKEFYDSIATLFTFLTGGKRGTGKKAIDTGKGLLELPQTTDDTIKKNFAVRLIGRLIFCWFLKKKKSKSKDGIALLPEQLLSAEAIKPNKGIGVFYHSVLEPLFFEVLNTPIDERNNEFKKEPWSIIPFLNGGLFAPHEDDFYKLTFNGISEHLNTLIIPDDWLKELFKVFETYNFTIDENTSIDVELSIEPEMLGRIFENLLAEINPETGETARKATGSYYTPRPIVEYMVDESIKQYLATKTGIADDKFVTLLSYSDEDAYLTEIEKDNILNALDTIKIIDPACGSGAFPMGILQKILLILQKIDPDSKKWLKRILAKIDNTLARKEFEKELKSETINYIHKLGIIQNSIFGVDIQPIAVEISKLRFFLSLIVDENVNDKEKNRGVKPLPNLEFKFVCANTLIDLPKAEVAESKKSQSKYGPKEYKGQNLMLEATDEISELKKLRDEYLNSYGKEKILIEEKFRKVQSKMFDHSLNWQGKETQTL